MLDYSTVYTETTDMGRASIQTKSALTFLASANATCAGALILLFLFTSTTAKAQTRFVETGGAQTNYVGLQAPTSVTGNFTLSLPPNDGAPNQCLATNGAGLLQWRSTGSSNSLDASDGSPTNALFVNAAGNVGIGTTNAGAALQVNTGVNKAANTGTNALILSSNDPDSSAMQIGFSLFTSSTASLNYAAFQSIEQGIAYRNLIINPMGGNVGIGTTNPLAPLHVAGDAGASVLQIGPSTSASSATATIILRGKSGGTATGNAVITTTNSNDLQLSPAILRDLSFIKGDGSAVQMIVKDSGNVGIGTTAPQTNLDVNGGVAANSSYEGISAYVNTNAAYVIPDTTMNIRRLTLNNSATITLPAFTSPTSKIFALTLFLKQDATGSRTVTLAGNGSDTVKWDNNVAPTIAPANGKITILQLVKPSDETVWYGSMTWKEN